LPSAADLLLPRPSRLSRRDGQLELGATVQIAAPPGAERALEALTAQLLALGLESERVESSKAGDVRLDLSEEEVEAPEGYQLQVAPEGVRLLSASAAGLFYGAGTLVQWLRLTGSRSAAGWRLPSVEVSDAPAFAARGFMLDVSRNRVPRAETLFALVDLLAALKINQLQLYTEHTFAYEGHEVVWRDASALTAGEIRELDAYCAARFIELVPNQNSFGHFHRWLVHEPYRPLAERPDGVRHPFGRSREPFSLCPVDPGSLGLLENLYGQLLPNFRSRLLNVGLDETFDLGTGRSAAACRERGKEEVYVDYLRQVHRLVSASGHRMQFWGDIILTRPDLIARLPTDVIALDWGYEADHPFGDECRRFAEAGLEFYVCPGTSSWCSLGGRLENALGNLASAAAAGARHGATGYLITDWGDFGHLQPLVVSYPGLLAGAAHAWSAEARELPMAELLEHHVPDIDSPGLAAALLQLGRAHEQTGVHLKNSTVLFHLLLSADRSLKHPRFEELSETGLAKAAEALSGVDAAVGPTPSTLAERETAWASGMLALACAIGTARLKAGRARRLSALPMATRRSLVGELDRLLGELSGLWLERSRPGGLPDSLAHLERIRTALAVD
jgi:hypothetical protein